MIKIIIAGGRDYTDVSAMEVGFLKHFNKYRNDQVEIVSGMARGADSVGVELAMKYDLVVHEYPALWHMYGRSAGYKRNVQMAENATHLLAFWDGVSKGTEHMINIAKRMGLKTIIVKY